MNTTTTLGPAPLRADVLAGVRAMGPWLAGVTPFGLVIGVSAAQADIPAFAGWLTGPLIVAGSAQVATIELLDAGAAPAVVVLSALIINLRLVLYSAAMAPHWRHRPRWWRLMAAYLLIDPSFAVGVARYEQPGERSRADAHYIGGAVVLYAAWFAAIGAGVVLGAQLPAGLRLEFVIPLFLVGEVVPKLAARATRRAALSASGVAVLAMAVPLHLGLVIAIIAGLAAGLLTKEAG
ncbi:branched-chain amino acid ABC transporter permease [Phytoactinopolyspora alkaliphila]|uniref:Branched-chain amino acid ABC transporter permease n=1 Tax=Phytoactinopolyspora alkaliphila TaxID=1783498 RepID=A0A6N9YTI0_9ACTN|nr:AzlC family ABC transporter permease [Phytoactinopolyspora alkaliphila]NED98138.1 branched-chain amino acid ABC transporter permease [Phytoactinopolyspora alkaliphila]